MLYPSSGTALSTVTALLTCLHQEVTKREIWTLPTSRPGQAAVPRSGESKEVKSDGVIVYENPVRSMSKRHQRATLPESDMVRPRTTFGIWCESASAS